MHLGFFGSGGRHHRQCRIGHLDQAQEDHYLRRLRHRLRLLKYQDLNINFRRCQISTGLQIHPSQIFVNNPQSKIYETITL